MRRELAPWLTGRSVLAIERIDAAPGPKTADLERAVGQRIEAVARRGKFLLLPLRRAGAAAAEDELVIHLGMTGVLSPTPPVSHLRLRLRLDGPPPDTLHLQDARRFARVLVVPLGDYRSLPTLAAMGPEPLEDAFTAAAFERALACSAQAVKTYLLTQRPVSGVGNIYADEALWRARIHPETRARALSRGQARRLHGAIREVLVAALELQGTTLFDYRTVNGEVGAYSSELDVYGHAGDPCPRCGAPIVRLVLGQRGTHVCPRCQRRPAGRASTRAARPPPAARAPRDPRPPRGR